MTHLNIEKISLACRDRDREEQKRNFQKKTLMVLIHAYLETNSLVQTARTLLSESRHNIVDYEVCDNIHLESILQDFESYFFLKYQKLPVIVKKSNNQIANNSNKKSKGRVSSRLASVEVNDLKQPRRALSSRPSSIDMSTRPDSRTINEISNVNNNLSGVDPLENLTEHCPEWKSMASLVMQDFVQCEKLTWSDVVGHETAKELLKEAIIYPLQYPDLFHSFSSTWKSILLYGPTGTGKSLLARVSAAESRVGLFKITFSSIISKWRGESEKLVKVIFDLAKLNAPSIIFIDEIDVLLSHRGSDHEASRRMKAEFLLQMDQLASCNKLVVLIGASNMPWEIDLAILRRLEKRILVPFPDFETRASLFKKFLPPTVELVANTAMEFELDYEELSRCSENYSAADIELICKETKMKCIRNIVRDLQKYEKNKNRTMLVEILKMSDVLSAIQNIKPAAAEMAEKYLCWKQKYGAE